MNPDNKVMLCYVMLDPMWSEARLKIFHLLFDDRKLFLVSVSRWV